MAPDRDPARCPSCAGIIDASSDAIIGLTVDGTVTSWNRAAERVYGRTADAMLGASFFDLIPTALRAAEGRLHERALLGQEIAGVETERLHADGGNRIVSRTIVVQRSAEPGAAPRLFSIERDVTSARSMEKHLLQARRLEAAGRLSAGIAQEFNNVNTTVIGLLDFVLPEIDPASPVRLDLGEIQRQILRAAQLARSLLVFSSREPRAPHAIDIDGFLGDTLATLRRLVADQGAILLDLDARGATVVADESLLELALFEIILDALDSYGHRTPIRIATRLADEGELELSVVLSLPPDATSRDGALAGPLRFAIAATHDIVGPLGGRVAVDRRARGEIAIAIRFPVAGNAATLVAVGEHGDETILVVEDEPAVREVMTRSLRSRGYRVLEAKDGEDALSVAERFRAPIQLVISDVVLPHMDGRALFNAFRRGYPAIRFLFVSGYSKGTLFTDAMRDSATPFLPKPFNAEDLCHEVRRLLEKPSVWSLQ